MPFVFNVKPIAWELHTLASNDAETTGSGLIVSVITIGTPRQPAELTGTTVYVTGGMQQRLYL